MKKFILIATILASLGFSTITSSEAATCNPNGSCAACKNCKYCKHCSKEGGSCSVCSRRSEASKDIHKPKVAKKSKAA